MKDLGVIIHPKLHLHHYVDYLFLLVRGLNSDSSLFLFLSTRAF